MFFFRNFRGHVPPPARCLPSPTPMTRITIAICIVCCLTGQFFCSCFRELLLTVLFTRLMPLLPANQQHQNTKHWRITVCLIEDSNNTLFRRMLFRKKFSLGKWDSGWGLGLKIGIGIRSGLVYFPLFLSFSMLDSDFVIGIAFSGIVSFGIVPRTTDAMLPWWVGYTVKVVWTALPSSFKEASLLSQ